MKGTRSNIISSFLSDVSGNDSTGSSSYSDQQGDRYKRRCMLQFTGINIGGFAQDSPPPYETVVGSPTNTYSSYSSYSSSYGVRLLSLARPALVRFLRITIISMYQIAVIGYVLEHIIPFI